MGRETRRTTIRALLLGLVALAIGWRVVVASEHPGGARDELAAGTSSRGTPAVPTGASSAASSATSTSSPTATDDAIRAARQRIAADPLDALRVMALAREAFDRGRRDDALAAIEQAVALAPANPSILAEAGGRLLQLGYEPEGLALLERLVRLYPETGDTVWPVFDAALTQPRHREFFVNAARADARWWPQFFANICASAPPVALQSLLLARLAAGNAKDDERRCALARFQRDRQWNVAYQLWLNGLPPAQTAHIPFVFNGDFERPLSNMGFDWLVPQRAGIGVGVERASGAAGAGGAGGTQALHVRFTGQRYEGPPVYEYVVLPPGRFRLEGRARPDRLETWTGVRLALYCNGDGTRDGRLLAKSETLSGTSDWRPVRSEFNVGRDCPLQVLRVEVAGPNGDQPAEGGAPIRVRGSAWLDDIRIAAID